MPRTTTLAVLLVSVCLLVGCSSEKVVGQAVAAEPVSSGEAEPPPSTTPPASEPVGGGASEPCELLTGEDVGKHLGVGDVTAEPSPEETTEDDVTIYLCEYTGGGEPLGALTVSVYEAPGNSEELLDAKVIIDAVKEGYTAPKDVPNVGEAAATFDDADGRYLAAAKILSEAVVMAMWVGDKKLTVEQLTAMVKQTIDKL